jgi:hypothetical protein
MSEPSPNTENSLENTTSSNITTNGTLKPIRRLHRDLVLAASSLSVDEARYLVDAYYSTQEHRKAAANQVRALAEAQAPHSVIAWLMDQNETLEKQIKRALDSWTDSLPAARWAKCAPPWVTVMTSNSRSGANAIPIESLRTGDSVVSFNRHKAGLTHPVPVTVANRNYSGELIRVETSGLRTETTPNHRWLVKWNFTHDVTVVYLMRRGTDYRVGWCNLFRGGRKLRLRERARQERAEAVWVLKVCANRTEASLYESYVSTVYGITQMPFQPVTGAQHLSADALDRFFEMLSAADYNSSAHAAQCLAAHNLDAHFPLFTLSPNCRKEAVASAYINAVNLLPEVMSVPVPPQHYGTVEWRKLDRVERIPYCGPVYSMDVPEHHKYVQDGVITCNSIVGIGPVISAGLAAHIDVTRSNTVGHIWRFAGLDPTVEWKKGEKRPWNASLKCLCWTIGESFVKVSGRPDDFYGQLYLQRKQIEQQRNEAGGLADQAARKLERFKIGKDTDAYKAYAAGKLPPAHIHARAKRWAVKLFLAHYHHVAWTMATGTPPPKPYVISILGHADMIMPPNFPMKEAA